MATYEQAKLAKVKAVAVLKDRVDLAGVGIQGSEDQYSLRAHLMSPIIDGLPEKIDGVNLDYKFVGNVTISDNV